MPAFDIIHAASVRVLAAISAASLLVATVVLAAAPPAGAASPAHSQDWIHTVPLDIDGIASEPALLRGNTAYVRAGALAALMHDETFDPGEWLPARIVLESAGFTVQWHDGRLALEGTRAGKPARPETERLLYIHPEHGYLVTYSAGWRLDTSLEPVMVTLSSDQAVLEILLEDGFSSDSYLGYGNRSILEERSGIHLFGHGWEFIGPHPAFVIRWSRPALQLEPDLRQTWEAHLPWGRDRWLSVVLRATDQGLATALPDARALVEGIRRLDPGQRPEMKPAGFPPRTGDHRSGGDPARFVWAEPVGSVAWGIYDPTLPPLNPDWSGLTALERQLDYHFPLLMTYQRLGQRFPAQLLETAGRQGRTVMLTLQSWEPMDPALVYTQARTLIYDILQGRFDDTLRAYARAAAATKTPFLFRLDNEMNADWSPWGAYHYGKDTSLYREAWRRVHRIFREQGAVNALFVWNPHDRSYPPFEWNHQHLYYPGDDYVDVVGLTVYNAGDAYPFTTWRAFPDMLEAIYPEYERLYGHKPFMITEFASHSGGGDKAAWIRSIPETLARYPNIKAAVWWHHIDDRRDYRIDSDPGTLEAMRQALRHPYSDTRLRLEVPSSGTRP